MNTIVCRAISLVAFGIAAIAGGGASAGPMLSFTVVGAPGSGIATTSTGLANTIFTKALDSGLAHNFSLEQGQSHTFNFAKITADPQPSGFSIGVPQPSTCPTGPPIFPGFPTPTAPCTWEGTVGVDLGFSAPVFGSGVVSAAGSMDFDVACTIIPSTDCEFVSGTLAWTTPQPQTFLLSDGSSFAVSFSQGAFVDDPDFCPPSASIFCPPLGAEDPGTGSFTVRATVEALVVAGTAQATGIPEPAGVTLFALGLAGLGLMRRRMRVRG